LDIGIIVPKDFVVYSTTGEAETVSVVLEATVLGRKGDIGIVVGVVETAGID